MAQCYFCGRKFDSRQGVRAHLKTCVAYQNRDFESRPGPDVRKAEPTGRSAYQASVPKAKSFHYPSQVPRQITAEKERTKISDFPLDEIPPEEQMETHEENQNVLLRSALERAKGAERRERVKRARIETGKRYAEGILKGIRFLNHWELYTANNEVEKALKCELTGEEPPADAERIAEGALAPWLEKEKRQEREQKQKEVEERRWQRKRELINYGKTYAREAAAEEGLSPLDKIIFNANVQRELEKELDGSESEEDVEALVDEILDEALEEVD